MLKKILSTFSGNSSRTRKVKFREGKISLGQKECDYCWTVFHSTKQLLKSKKPDRLMSYFGVTFVGKVNINIRLRVSP